LFVKLSFISADSNNIALKKRLKTTDTQNDEHCDGSENEEIDKQKGNLFKHVTESNTGDTETFDAATSVSLFY